MLLNTKFQLINVPFTPNNINNTDNKNRNNIASSSSSSSSNNNNNEVNGPYRAYNHNSVSLYESYTGEDEDEVLNEENRFSTYDSDTASSENEDYMEITGNEVMHTERVNNEITEDSDKKNTMETDTNEDINLNKVNMETDDKENINLNNNNIINNMDINNNNRNNGVSINSITNTPNVINNNNNNYHNNNNNNNNNNALIMNNIIQGGVNSDLSNYSEPI